MIAATFAKTGAGWGLLLAGVLLAGCVTGPVSEMRGGATPVAGISVADPPAGPTRVAATPVAAVDEADPPPPLEKHEAAAQCWMRVDKSRVGNIDERAKLVDKCIIEKMKAANR